MKKTALISSIMTIVLCVSLIAGSTFALFTSQTDVDIAVDAGRVNITAGLVITELWSVKPFDEVSDTDIVDKTFNEYDENGKLYHYVKRDGKTFANGGTAELSDRQNDDGSITTNGVITLTNMTPGDKIVFKLTGLNDSDVAVQYRYKIECIEGFDLMSGFVSTVEGVKYAAMAAYTSEWNPLLVGENITENNAEGIQIALELPVSAGNEFQELDAKIKVSVEAVQNNADVSETDTTEVKYITTVKDSAELLAKLAADEILHIFVREDITEKVVITSNLTNKTIDANGNNVNLQFGKADAPIVLDNVVVMNLKDNADNVEGITLGAYTSGDLTIVDSVLNSGASYSASAHGAIAGNGTPTSLDLTLERCELISSAGDKYGLYMTNAKNVTVRDTKFTGFGSWAILINGTTDGNIVISGCTFTDCAGIFKTAVTGVKDWQTGSLNGNFTFANNKMYNCTMKDNTFMQVKTLYGSVTFSNNTHNDIVITVEDMKCDYLTNKYNAQ